MQGLSPSILGQEHSECGNFQELQRNLHVPVDRVCVTRDRACENDEPPAVVGYVVLQVGLQTDPWGTG